VHSEYSAQCMVQYCTCTMDECTMLCSPFADCSPCPGPSVVGAPMRLDPN
jgi:hypothetical protein